MARANRDRIDSLDKALLEIANSNSDAYHQVDPVQNPALYFDKDLAGFPTVEQPISTAHIPEKHKIKISDNVIESINPKNSDSSLQILDILVETLSSFASQKLAEIEKDSQKLNETAAFHGIDMIFSCCQLVSQALPTHHSAHLIKLLQDKSTESRQKSKIGELFYSKPRGYAGDFEMMEAIWQHTHNFKHHQNTSTEAAFEKFYGTRNACKAVVWRVGYFMNKLRQLHAKSIASIGCGPAIELRELARKHLLKDTEIHLYDQDKEALTFAQSQLALLGKETQLYPGNIFKTMFRMPLDKYDFIYSSGLFDYIPTDKAQRLSKVLFEKLAPGGCLIITNAGLQNPSKFYQESLLDWYLIHKSKAEMFSLAENLAHCKKVEYEIDPYNVFQYICIHKEC